MKTYKNLYASIYNFSNLYQAFRNARRGKRDRAAVASFEFDLEHNLLALVAHQVGVKLEYDVIQVKATNCPEADKYIRRTYRPGWTLNG